MCTSDTVTEANYTINPPTPSSKTADGRISQCKHPGLDDADNRLRKVQYCAKS